MRLKKTEFFVGNLVGVILLSSQIQAAEETLLEAVNTLTSDAEEVQQLSQVEQNEVALKQPWEEDLLIEAELERAMRRDGWALTAPEEKQQRRVRVQDEEQRFVVLSPSYLAQPFLQLLERSHTALEDLFPDYQEEFFPIYCTWVEEPAPAGDPVYLVRLVHLAELGPYVELAFRGGDGLNATTFHHGMIEALLLERVVRKDYLENTDRLPDFIKIPFWFTTGVTELLQQKAGKKDRKLAEGLLSLELLPSLEEVISYDHAESIAEKRIFSLACAALLEVILTKSTNEQHGAIFRWLGQQSTQNSDRALQLFTLHFVSHDLELSSLWEPYTEKIRAMSLAGPLDRYSCRETIEQIRQGMVAVTEGEAAGESGEDPIFLSFEECLQQWESVDAVQVNYWYQMLGALQFNCHPLYTSSLVRLRGMCAGLISGELSFIEAKQVWDRENQEMEFLDSLIQEVQLEINTYELNNKIAEFPWIVELAGKRKQRHELLFESGIYSQRLDLAERQYLLRQNTENEQE